MLNMKRNLWKNFFLPQMFNSSSIVALAGNVCIVAGCKYCSVDIQVLM